ncbi:hypothetical protein N7468_006837 [Penicillium chermesinum]|uniref:DNA-binding protein RAP1 n=1 Tax=Penicillium chermesinum TaxID=63820 RepID=A0A9W9NSZ0_9EURO|nr:uncharacterized protein N7468_006837 [Penicillium chermesinum]KAJ5225612.1 hypothetical protein N7468_006837 [Penicillium chermesinum]
MAAPGSLPTHGGLFDGATFWLDRRIPQRTMIRDMITSQGGSIVLQEKDADVRVVDHLRHDLKEVTVNTVSYKYIERSVQNNKVEDFNKHRVGSTGPRPMGASHIARKGTRKEYTREDDQLLYDWLQPYEQIQGAPINGNKIYQDIANEYPHHTWQSWRTRYLRTVRGKPRPGGPKPSNSVPYRHQLQLAPPPQTTASAQSLPPKKSSSLKTARPSVNPSVPAPPVLSPSRVPAAASPSRSSNPNKRKRPSVPDTDEPASPDMAPSKQGELLGTSDAIDSMANFLKGSHHRHPWRPSGEPISSSTPSSDTPPGKYRHRMSIPADYKKRSKSHAAGQLAPRPVAVSESENESQGKKQLASNPSPNTENQNQTHRVAQSEPITRVENKNRERTKQPISKSASGPESPELEHTAESPTLYFLDMPHCSSAAEDDEADDEEEEDGSDDEDEDDEDPTEIEDWVHAQMARWNFDERTVKEILIRTSNNPYYAKRACVDGCLAKVSLKCAVYGRPKMTDAWKPPIVDSLSGSFKSMAKTSVMTD